MGHQNFDVCCEWGLQGIKQLAATSDVVIIVDVLSFSTCVDIATEQRAVVFPYRVRDATAREFAGSVQAILAKKRGEIGYSLSPASLLQLPATTRLVLPSPNGATLSLATGKTPTLAGCLRNCQAVALAATQYGASVTVVPAGERWLDGSLRPAFEDWVGAGAIIQNLPGRLSPNAQVAVAAYQSVATTLKSWVQQCPSGQELIGIGFGADVDLATDLNVSVNVPTLVDGAYRTRPEAVRG